MTEIQLQDFFQRIDNLTSGHPAKFGQMNAHQMICHCTDQLRMAMNIRRALVYGNADPEEILRMAKARITVPAPKGLGQVEGEGTMPVNFENDKKLLKEHISQFSSLPGDFNYPPHPYFGNYDKKQWEDLVIYHLNHHLKQFNV